MTSSTSYIPVLSEDDGILYWYALSAAGIHETINGWLGQFVAEYVTPLAGAGLVQYDNAPAINPGESIHVLSEVRFEDTEHVAGYSLNHYRKTGTLDLTVRGPVGQGDDAVLEMAEDIRQLFQGVDVPVAIHFRAPRAVQVGRVGGWFEATASCPWWYSEFADKSTSVVGTNVNGDWADTANAIRGRFKTLVQTPLSLPTTYDDAPPSGKDGNIWARFTVRPAASLRVETPAAYQSLGIATAQVFAPLATGTGALYAVVDHIYESMRVCTEQGVVFQVPNVRTVGRGADYWQANVDCPFTAYQTAA